MKTIILAAGKSERLRPLTDKIPKCLVKIDNKTILERTIENCIASNLNDLTIVSGHGHDYVEKEINTLNEKYDIKTDIVYNKHYHDMNNCYSLFLGIENLSKNDIIIINSDDVFDKNILINICKEKNTSLSIDNVKQLTKESMKVYYKNKITDINKKLEINNSYGEYIGIAKIESGKIKSLNNALNEVINSDPNLYYEDAFQLMFNEIKFESSDTNGLKWTEIDTAEDLKIAKNLIKNNFN